MYVLVDYWVLAGYLLLEGSTSSVHFHKILDGSTSSVQFHKILEGSTEWILFYKFSEVSTTPSSFRFYNSTEDSIDYNLFYSTKLGLNIIRIVINQPRDPENYWFETHLGHFWHFYFQLPADEAELELKRHQKCHTLFNRVTAKTVNSILISIVFDCFNMLPNFYPYP